MRVKVVRRPFDIAGARAELDAYEAKYGVTSEHRDEPFWRGDQFHETKDWQDWDFVYHAWRIATSGPVGDGSTEK